MILWAITAFIVSAVVVGILTKVLRSRAIMQNPRADRWHTLPTPSFGGVGITLGIMIGGYMTDFDTRYLLFIAAAAGAGLLDDIFGLSPWIKIATQFSVVLPIWLLLSQHSDISVIVVSGLYVVMVNAINIFDNFDGVCAITALGSLSAALLFGWIPPENIGFALTGIGAIAGFYCYNFPPAKIFMGETGTAAITAILICSLISHSYTVIDNSLNILLLAAVPLADAVRVMVARTWRGQKFWHGGRDHAAHILSRVLSPIGINILFAATQAIIITVVFYIYKYIGSK